MGPPTENDFGQLVVAIQATPAPLDDFGAELAGDQHEDRLKAEVIEIGLEKRSACVFEVHPSCAPRCPTF
jgi:hypothetical protein